MINVWFQDSKEKEKIIGQAKEEISKLKGKLDMVKDAE
jgi:hypothetical protein